MTPFLDLVLAGFAVFVGTLIFGQIQCAMASSRSPADTKPLLQPKADTEFS